MEAALPSRESSCKNQAMPSAESLQALVQWCTDHLTGNEKRQAQKQLVTEDSIKPS